MLYIFFFYSLQYFLLINICISQEPQEGNPDLSLEEIYSNIHTRNNFPNTGNSIDTVNIEQDEILDLENISSHFFIEEKNSHSDNEDYPFSMGLVDTINLEKSESCDITNILDEVQCSLMDSLIKPFYPSFESDYTIDATHEKLFSVNNLMNTENVEHEDSVEIQNSLGEILSALPDSHTQPLDLPLEYENSTVHTETRCFNISLMDTKDQKHNDLYNPQSILDYSSGTPIYLKGGFLELLLEDQYPSISYENVLPTTSSLTIPRSVKNEEYDKLQIIPVDSPTEKPAKAINDNKDMSSVEEIEQISEECMRNEKNEEKIDEQIREENMFGEQNFSIDLPDINPSMNINSDNTPSRKKKGKKRNYEDIDNLGDQNIEENICIKSKKNYAYNQIGDDLVSSISNIFKMQINCLPDSVVLSLQKLRDILDDDNKSTYNNIEKKMNINILLLREIITEEIKKMNPSDLRVIREYYDENIKEEKLVKSINRSILSFNHETSHEFNRKEIHKKIKQILEIFEDLANEHRFLRDLYHLKSDVMDKFIYNKLFSFSLIQSLEVCKRIFGLFQRMDELIERAEKSIKDGFILVDRSYFCETQKIMSSLYISINATIRNNLVKMDYILKKLNLSYKNHSIIVEVIFHFFKKENAKNMEKLKPYMNNPYKKNSLEAIYDFLLEEESCISCIHNEASEIFNVNLNEKNKEGMSFDDLISNENYADHLFSLYEILMKLIGGLFTKRQLTIIMEVRRSLYNMNSLRARKYISYKTKKILNKEHQLNLISQIEKEKCRMENIKLNIKRLHLFVTTKDEIKRIKVSSHLVDKINRISSILHFICKITYESEDKTNPKKKKTRIGSILLALYYANQRLLEFTENEIQ
ncbi:fam-j protein [Plasmodium relictum]|uniref:Fam-j protein n=1 Tax=Plasmodium relictum TaxID=85471 RepID=A0A1J1GK18_PLARL|nr:fam-j protein [Plasmodium relictum]CRG84478.1 fam-j protein [Plasmodium relictum]